MKLTVNREQFARAVAEAAKIADAKSSMRILSHLLLSARDGGLEITANDLEVALSVRLEAQAQGGPVALAARPLAQMAGQMVGDELTIEVGESRARISDGRTVYRLHHLPGEEFPAGPEAGSERVAVDATELAELLGSVIYAAATDAGRYNLAGVLLERQDDGGLRAVATNGHRLALCDRPIRGLPVERALLPRKAAAEAVRLLREAEGEVVLGVSESTLDLSVGSSALAARLLETRYPDYRQVLPEGELATITVSRPDLLGAIARIQIVSPTEAPRLILEASDSRLTISAPATEIGEGREEVDAALGGADELQVALNPAYLTAALKGLRSEEVALGVAEPTRPISITGPADEGVLAVVMPMQVG